MVLKTSNFPVDILKATVQNNLSAWEPEAWTVARDWQDVVAHFLKTASARALGQFVQSRLAAGALIYPSQPFRALLLTPLNRVRVVILGQDPYHSPGQAEGLAFSVAPGKNLPPSLRNIYKELARDQAVAPKTARYNNGSLIRWAEQGVLLLNTCLTVEDGLPASHANRGWEVLTDEIIKTVWSSQSPVVFLLWGARAQTKRALLIDSSKDTVTAKRHLVLSANHPSPLSAMRAPLPFIGCGHFGQTNSFLAQQGLDLIDW